MTTQGNGSKGLSSTVGPFIGTLIIILLLVVGALYIFAQNLASRSNNSTGTTTSKGKDDLKTIESDLKGTDVIQLDSKIKTLK